MATSPPISPDAREAIARDDLPALRATLEASPLAKQLGIAFSEFHPGRATARMPGSEMLPNFLGFAHTGAIFALAEQAMAAAANSLGYVGLPLNCEIHFLKGAQPDREISATAHVVDTQGRIARVQVEIFQDETLVARISEMVFLRSGVRG